MYADAYACADQAEHGEWIRSLLNLGGIQPAPVKLGHLPVDQAGNDVVSESHQGLAGDLGERDLVAFGEGMILGNDGHHRLFEERLDANRSSSHQPLRKRQKENIEPSLVKAVDLGGGRCRHDVQTHSGGAGTKPARESRKDGVVRPEGRADREVPQLATRSPATIGHRMLGLLDDEASPFVEDTASRGEFDRAAVAIDELSAKLLLEPPYLLTETWLGHPKSLRRPAKVSLLGDNKKRPHVTQLDVHSSRTIIRTRFND